LAKEQKDQERGQLARAEYYKLAHDTHKHPSTLNAGSIVLLATFLKGIFPKAIGLPIKLLAAASFLSFGFSLATSSFLVARYARRTLEESLEETFDHDRRVVINLGHGIFMVARNGALLCFVLGLAFFGTAVLINLFWNR
jgi:hypothetical protein